MAASAGTPVQLETVAPHPDEDRPSHGAGGWPAHGDLDGVSGKSYGHLSPSMATQVGRTNDWLKPQGLVSLRDLWRKAQGYA